MLLGELEKLAKRLAVEGRWRDSHLVCEALYRMEPIFRYQVMAWYTFSHGRVTQPDTHASFKLVLREERKRHQERMETQRFIASSIMALQNVAKHLEKSNP